MIPFLSLKDQTAALKPEVLAALEKVIDSQGFANGPAVEVFEKQLATFLGVKEVVCVNSGTTSLHAALLATGVKPGDDVLTVSHTWISTCWAITYAGAKPVFCDIDPATCGLDPAELAKKITPKTRAILPVHLYGQPVDMDPILAFAKEKGLPVIEDCAQSIGAKYKGKQTGSLGTVNATSFYPGKNLGAYGEGGAAMTNDAEMAARMRRLRDHAQQGRHNHVEIGFNWRMDGFQGAVLSIKLAHLDAWNARRRAIAERYLQAFEGLKGVRTLPKHAWSEAIWHLFPVFHERRDDFRAALEKRGVQSGVHYPTPIHLQPAYAHLGVAKGSLPQSERAAATEISLPMFPELTDAQADEVIAAVKAVAAELG
ncbi:MAG TPA: DegT/DnrJ/EryC1/StrS family aminotransferase [Labilithrix sp.]|nr:DegT/DnrJ/EryC1/StrS family aminotransferase [Labilithrix sp.]